MEEVTRRRYLGILRETPARLKDATRGLGKAVSTWTPAPERWSAIEIACHLRDIDRLYVERVTKAAFASGPNHRR
jgi:hypothetical protein